MRRAWRESRAAGGCLSILIATACEGDSITRSIALARLAECNVTSSAAVMEPRRVPVDSAVLVEGAGQFPVLARVGSEVFAVFRGRGAHVGLDGRIDVVVADDGARNARHRAVAVDGPLDDRNPALGVTRSGSLLLAYTVLDAYDETGVFRMERARLRSFITRSADRGLTWSTPVALDITPFEWSSPFGKIVSHGDELVLAMYGGFYPVFSNENKTTDRVGFFAFVIRSGDDGRTWSRPEVIAQGFSEPALLALTPDEMLAVLRSQQDNRLVLARWTRGQSAWSVGCALTRGGEVPGDLVRLPSGAVMLTYGHRTPPYGVHARLSADAGRTWSDAIALAHGVDAADLGYPSSVALGSRVLTAYYRDSGARRELVLVRSEPDAR
ncbi:MAG TPA: sialidase family protein [Gemmatimonadaceae bacterium]|nr:sialidase family protein [Gemmatimonadaceae bacterium]